LLRQKLLETKWGARAHKHGLGAARSIRMDYSMTSSPFFGYLAPELSYPTQNQGFPSQTIESYSIDPTPTEPPLETLPLAAQPTATHDHISNSFDLYSTPHTIQPHNVQPSSDIRDIPVQSMGPPIKPRKGKAPTLRSEAWHPYKDRIIELHITQDLPLPEVKKIIEKEPGFSAEYASS
jgi:Clr5 domain